MVEATCHDYSNFFDIKINEKLQPINQTIDQMLTRLEEFETMVALVQQERCTAMGMTGTITEAMDLQKDLDRMCAKIDTVEAMVEHLKIHVNSLENKIKVAEEQFGLVDNTNKLKSFFMPLFKKNVETSSSSVSELDPVPLDIDKYLLPEN